jgi:hypothetical protein
MRASKENCLAAAEKCKQARRLLAEGSGPVTISPLLDEVQQFLDKAVKRLPTEKAIDKDKARKRKKKEKK